ncbi:uncharacterized protein LOC135224534 [Macrobrachium nipponense]|uniref:uncharacterized protein LOC135224534 n=1 Tax=Macrobrachium nipponense TaxID=159736 RepID=UPI0030C7DC64
MTLFRMPRIIRRLIRRRTRHIPERDALTTRKNLSYAYAFLAWNVFGYVAYLCYTGRLKKADEDTVSQGRYFAKLLQAKNVTLVRVEGLTHVSTVKLDDEYSPETPLDTVGEELENITEENISGNTEV